MHIIDWPILEKEIVYDPGDHKNIENTGLFKTFPEGA